MRNRAELLAEYIKKLSNFEIATEIDGNYQNMGATIIDGILQAGVKYKTTVKPRVVSFLREHPTVRTTQEFKTLIDKHTVPKLIEWKDSAKTQRILKLTEFLLQEGVNSEDEFREWLNSIQNISKLKRLSGIKDKTADYFKILTGHSTSAVDRHIINFLKKAGIIVTNYEDAHKIISDTARVLDIEESYFDHSIWKYMSESKSDIEKPKVKSCLNHVK